MKSRIKAIAALLVALVPAINIILVMFGKSPLPFSQDEVNVGISAVIEVLGIFYAWYKNQNITNEAQTAQAILDKLKADKNKVGGESDIQEP